MTGMHKSTVSLLSCLLFVLAVGMDAALADSKSAATAFANQPVPLGKPAPESADTEVCRVIAFEDAELTGGFVNDSYFLSVSGVKSHMNMTVDLRPYVYVEQPEYWKIEVVGCVNGIGIPATENYVVNLWVTNYLGTEGVEVVGSNKTLSLALNP